MGENLVAFRDHSGTIGVLQEFCAHRRASLFYGRNENIDSRDGNCGLRCSYHGWKYDVTGQCIDLPNEPPQSRFKKHIKLTSYPAVERGGIVWIYMGPAELKPELPELEWAMLPEAHRFASLRIQQSNYLQAMEGGIDSSHVSFLHSDAHLWNPEWTHSNRGDRKHLVSSTAPRFFIQPTDYGMFIGARRETTDDRYYWRITQWLMPWFSMVPRDAGESIAAHAWVPIDDYRCLAWSVNYHPERPLMKKETDFYRNGGGIHAELIPGTNDPVRNAANHYHINRVLQQTVSFTGISGIAMQDVAMQESMGAITDRQHEHLGSSDAAIIAARKRLAAEARALRETGESPSGTDPAGHRVRSATVILPKDADWVKETSAERAAQAQL
jgi:phenylpropionate dioxygenase-like ring-hydroxylating dioxygenase large terminal subunit